MGPPNLVLSLPEDGSRAFFFSKHRASLNFKTEHKVQKNIYYVTDANNCFVHADFSILENTEQDDRF
jgi:hypothetical protein